MSMASILGKPQEKKVFSPDARFVMPSTLIGMEFEYEGVEKPSAVHESGSPFAGLWEQHREDSLKDLGAEYVFRHPLFGQDAYNAINFLMDFAAAQKWKCSLRAGIHVHIDIRDLETPQLIGMTILYAIVEPLLYRWIGQNRENSVFCVPFYKADEALLSACSIIHTAMDDERSGGHSVIAAAEAFERYAGLNLQALSKFGSAEFRHMRTTHDKQRVFDWVNMIMSLKATTYKLPQSDGAIVRMAENLTATQLLNYVFGELGRQLWVPEASELIGDIGIPTARDLALHGCTKEDWTGLAYPKGEHAGFKKFLETSKKEEAPVQRPIEILNVDVPAPPDPIARRLDELLRGANVDQEDIRNARAFELPRAALNRVPAPPPNRGRARRRGQGPLIRR